MTGNNPRPLPIDGALDAKSRTSSLAGNAAVQILWRKTWGFLISMRLAIILILLLTVVALIGTLLIQVQPEVAADPGEYTWWRENVVRPKLGMFTTPLYLLGLFDVFHSPYFLGTGALLILNIVACAISRWKQMQNMLTGGRVRLADAFYETGANQAQFRDLDAAPEQASASVARALTKRGYRLRQEVTSAGVYIAADKNRHFRLATYLHHGSIVLFIIGFMLGSFMGFRNRSFMIPEGSVRDVGYGTQLSMRLESFVDEYWPEGPPKDFRSDVVLYDGDKEVRRQVLRVNHPLKYEGVRFYQSFFGPAAALEVRDKSGNLLFNDSVALGWLTGDKPYKRPTGVFSVPETGITAYVIAPAQGYFDPLIRGGEMRMEVYRTGSGTPIGIDTLEPKTPKTLAGLEFTFVRERQFSGFQVSKDPGNMVIWISSSLFMLGLIMVFYFPYHQVWAKAFQGKDGKTRILLRTTSTRSFATASEFEGVVEQVGATLSTTKNERQVS